MRLRATVRRMTGRTTHVQGVRLADAFVVTAISAPEAVEIMEQDEAVYLLRLNHEGECVADTWHETIEAAKAQASFEYGVKDSDWKDADARH
jgi:hypothetical protein